MLLSAIIMGGAGTLAFTQDRNDQFASNPSSPRFSFTKTNTLLATNNGFVTPDNYPTPDFSGIEEWYTVVKYEYDFTETIPKFYLVVKKKVDKAPLHFEVKWFDEDGVVITKSVFPDLLTKGSIAVGEPMRIYSYAPYERQMPKVKSITLKKTAGQLNSE